MSKGETNFLKEKNIFKINLFSHQENYTILIIKPSLPPRFCLALFIALGVTQYENNLNNDFKAVHYIFQKKLYIF